MKKSNYNDQAAIAEAFQMMDAHIEQISRLAFFKINSYKLSMIKTSFKISKDDMKDIIKITLLNYTDPSSVLADVGFFEMEADN